MATYYVHTTATKRTTLTAWAATTAYAQGDKRKPTSAANRFWLECTTAGTSGGAEPTWSAVYGNTIVDGTVTWTYRGTGAGFGTAGDGAFHIEEMNATDNGLSLRDVVLCQGGTYTLGAVVTLGQSGAPGATNHNFYAPTNDAGALDFTKRIRLNCSGAVGAVNVAGPVVAMRMVVENSTAAGLNLSATSDGSAFFDCDFQNNTTYGASNAASSGNSIMAYCRFNDNGSSGVLASYQPQAATTLQGLTLYRCAARDNVGSNFFGSTNGLLCLGCESVRTDITADFKHYDGGTHNIILDSLVRTINTPNNAFVQSGFSTTQANALLLMFNTIVSGLNNSGAGTGVIDATLATLQAVVGGNVGYGNKTNAYNNTPKITVSALDTTNPSFVGTSDQSPQANLTSMDVFLPVQGATTGDFVGPYPQYVAPSGGGAGTIFHNLNSCNGD